MTKKELLEKILIRIAPDRPAAHGILLLMKQGVLSDEKIDSFVEIFRQAIEETHDTGLKMKLQGSLDLLKNIEILESQSKLEDEEELKKLEIMLNTL